MKRFFPRKPGIGALVVLGVFVGGGVLAHRTGGSLGKKLQPLSVSGSKAADTAAPDEPQWRDELNLGRAAATDDGRLVQRLRDGGQVTYTLDPGLQSWAHETMAKYELPYGAMVMTDVRRGSVLVMAGHSSRDDKVGDATLCLEPWAPAASVFKVVTAAALLARGVPSNARVCYHGGFRGLYERHITDNPKLDTACHSLSYAIAKSVNPIMAKLSLRHLTRDKLQAWAERFGFNQPIPFAFPVKKSRAEIPDQKLERARASAGFWHTELSPLHGAALAAVVASGGNLRWPHVVASVTDADGRETTPNRPAARRVMTRAAARSLGRMMERTTAMGTARRAFLSRRGRPFLGATKVAGKTGSLSRKSPFLHYNWFVGYAPADAPQVAFAVLVGNPPKWRIKAHTLSRMMLQEYFARREAARKAAKSKRSGKAPQASKSNKAI